MMVCFSIKKDILPYVHSLSQDCSVEVRAVMCMQLPAVAEGETNTFHGKKIDCVRIKVHRYYCRDGDWYCKNATVTVFCGTCLG